MHFLFRCNALFFKGCRILSGSAYAITSPLCVNLFKLSPFDTKNLALVSKGKNQGSLTQLFSLQLCQIV